MINEILDADILEMDEDELRDLAQTQREQMDSISLSTEIKDRDMQKYRERLARRDAKIARYEQTLRAIWGDLPCGQHHDAMAREALAPSKSPTVAV